METDHTPPSPARAGDVHLRVLQTSDLHGALRGYDYLADRPSAYIGLTRTASLIRAARIGAANALLFDTGDFLQGSPACDLAERTGLAAGQVHPMISAMNALGYDALALGNHDFNFGADFLLRALADAACPVVCANLRPRSPGEPLFAPYTILKRSLTATDGRTHDLRIAAIGCLPPQTTDWDHQLAADYVTEDMVQATTRAIAAAQTEGCHLVILLAHTGIDPDAPPTGAENALIALAALDGVDLVLGGHTHMVFPPPPDKVLSDPAIDTAAGRINGTPVLMPGFGGNHLGLADLLLRRDGAGQWRVADATCRALPVARRDDHGHLTDSTPEDPALVATIEPAHAATLRYIREPVGETRTPLHSFFSLLVDDNAVQLVAHAQADYLRRAIAGTPLAQLPLLSAAAPFKTGCLGGPDNYTHVPPGPLTRRSVADLYLFPNTFCAVRLSGRQITEWLENSASVFSRLTPDMPSDTPLQRPSFPGYRFDIVTGLTYRIDLSQPARYDEHHRLVDPAAHRIRDLCLNGEPVAPDQTFLVASNSYRVYGVGFPPPGPGDTQPPPEVVFEVPKSNHDILLDFVRNQGPLDLAPQPVWSFAPLGGATALFDTSPLARSYLDSPGLPPLCDLGDTPEGFARFRVTL